MVVRGVMGLNPSDLFIGIDYPGAGILSANRILGDPALSEMWSTDGETIES
jgi:hypothetical protein